MALASRKASTCGSTIAPSVVAELNDEQTTDLKQLFESAEEIEEVSAEDAVEERAAGAKR